jgi:membrane-bound lytic murein transglycosylase A
VVDAGLFDPAQAGRPGAAIDPGSGPLLPYPDRANIEAAPATALAWLRPEDLFFLQIQGSGSLVFEDGRRMKALYAANNGRPFVGLANAMRDRGLLPADGASGEAIHAWLAAHRGPDAQALMQLNPRYAFFSLQPDDGRPPVGAANLPLPAGRAVAVDRTQHAMGELLWVDAESPLLKGAFPTYRRLAVALDTGGAIQGQVRADLYLGEGPAAGAEAGRVRHTLRLYRLAPRQDAP